MEYAKPGQYTAFEGMRRVAAGELGRVVAEVKPLVDRGGAEGVVVFDDATGDTLEVDFRGTVEEVLKRLDDRGLGAKPGDPEGTSEAVEPRGPGRPKLGVVAREVTLLPRHWEWLNGQPGGASVALRRLVEEARRGSEGRDRARRSREVAYRFLSIIAGNEAGFEEAVRALFAGDGGRFAAEVAAWPPDVQSYAQMLATEGLSDVGTTSHVTA